MPRRYILILAILAALLFAVLNPFSLVLRTPEAMSPRRLEVDDNWTYKIVFPDSKSYMLTESVYGTDNVNGTATYVLFMDDPQHISTQYLWITADWREVKTFTPRIGNILANSTSIFTPPIQLFHVQFRVGDRWTVNSVVRIITKTGGTTIETKSLRVEERETLSIEEITTPIGKFSAFKVKVTVNGTLSEALWFNMDLGQVVYGEFYNDNEKVTQTLMGYKLSSNSVSTIEKFSTVSMSETRLFQENRPWKTFASYI